MSDMTLKKAREIVVRNAHLILHDRTDLQGFTTARARGLLEGFAAGEARMQERAAKDVEEKRYALVEDEAESIRALPLESSSNEGGNTK